MPSKWHVLAIVGTGVFMCTLDSSIVNVSLPAIAHYFHEPVGAEIEWVIIAYLVTIASTLLTIGRLADRLGHRACALISAVAIATSLLRGREQVHSSRSSPARGPLASSRISPAT